MNLDVNVAFLIVAIVYVCLDTRMILRYLPALAEERLRSFRPVRFRRFLARSSGLLLAALCFPDVANSLFFRGRALNGDVGTLGIASFLGAILVWFFCLMAVTTLRTFFPDFTLRLCSKFNLK